MDQDSKQLFRLRCFPDGGRAACRFRRSNYNDRDFPQKAAFLSAKVMNDSARDYAFALSCLRFLTPIRIRRLRERYPHLDDLRLADPGEIEHLTRLSAAEAKLVTDPFILPEIGRQLRDAGEFIACHEPDYPTRLLEIGDAPFAIRYRGRRELLTKPSIAIVGSRAASSYGKNAARMLAHRISTAGINVISGLARGVDTAAHEAALEHAGSTIAVLGTSLDIAYPKQNRALMDAIGERGLLISEFPAATRASRPNFPVRNRLIAGLALGVIVVEASERSGSLITARLAMEQGRDVFAVPGSIFAPASWGPHRLIQDGAMLLHAVEDLFVELSLPLRQPSLMDEVPEPLLTHLSFDEAIHPDVLSQRTGMNAGTLAAELMRLEAAGTIESVPGGRYLRRAEKFRSTDRFPGRAPQASSSQPTRRSQSEHRSEPRE